MNYHSVTQMSPSVLLSGERSGSVHPEAINPTIKGRGRLGGVRMTSKQVDRLLDILDRTVTVAERWADREYPKPDENPEESQLYRVGEQREAQTPEEYNALPEAPGRFEKRLAKAPPVQA